MRDLVTQAVRYSSSGNHVLITGETGTGKEVLVEFMCKESPRADKSFETVFINASNEDILASVLFGHKRGAFTGALENHQGIFERNNNGMIFIDEVSKLTLPVQEKLLRTVENGDIFPIGRRTERVDVQMFFATNQNLLKLVNEGLFREDLHFRLNALQINIPPLRKRKEDIIPLCSYYLKLFMNSYQKTFRGFTMTALKVLRNAYWDGNVRQLKNIMLKLAVDSNQNRLIDLPDLPSEIFNCKNKKKSTKGLDLQSELFKTELEVINRALKKNNYNQTRAAKSLNITRVGLIKKMKKLGLK